MPSAYTHINLADVEDAAPANGFGDRWEARVAREALDARQTGVTYFRLRPTKRSPFTHRHTQAEEVYVVLSGSGRVRLDAQLADVGPLDTIRVAPEVARAFEAGPEGLELLAFGPHHPGDGELVDDPWSADADVRKAHRPQLPGRGSPRRARQSDCAAQRDGRGRGRGSRRRVDRGGRRRRRARRCPGPGLRDRPPPHRRAVGSTPLLRARSHRQGGQRAQPRRARPASGRTLREGRR